MCGIKSEVGRPSQFAENEFVVYNTSQIKLKYLIEYGSPSLDSYSSSIPPSIPAPNMVAQSRHEFGNFQPAPFTTSQPKKLGLIGENNIILPLKSVIVKAKILDLAAEVVVFQTFRNDSRMMLLHYL